ncbi:hypothetical protein BJ170DRAFT_356093 [Xylariales sp. AK1849]|nr:hypothetical protein BJ170DRAFT_356093 [Xylariales sp. AK1849]
MSQNALSAHLGTVASSPYTLRTLRFITSASLLFLSGIAFCLLKWAVPILHKSPPKTRIAQFRLIIDRGSQYLLPSSRALGICLGSLTVLTAFHPNQTVCAQWVWYAGSTMMLAVMSYYEQSAIFPVNGEILAFAELERWTPEEERRLERLLDTWSSRHVWRIVVPVTAGLINLAIAAT